MSRKINKEANEKFNLEMFVEENFAPNRNIDLSSVEGTGSIANGEDFEDTGYTTPMLLGMKEEGLINSYDGSTKMPKLTKQAIIELANRESMIRLDEDGNKLYYHVETLDESGKPSITRVYIDSSNESPENKKDISLSLPEVTYDVMGDGSIESTLELKAIYTVLSVNRVFNNVYFNRIKEVIYAYDCEKLEQNDKTFRGLLEGIIEDAPREVNLVVAACRRKLNDIIIKKDMVLDQLIPQKEGSELRSIKLKIALHESVYRDRISQAEDKVEKLRLERERDVKKKEMISESSVETLYYIKTLNSDKIPIAARQRLNEFVREFTMMVKIKEGLSDETDIYRKFVRQVRRRAYREFLAEMRLSLYEAYTNGEKFLF